MNKKITSLAIVIGLSVILLVGFFVPLGSYTTTGGCPLDRPTPAKRLHLIIGDSLDRIKDHDNDPEPLGAGCTVDTKYTLYLL